MRCASDTAAAAIVIAPAICDTRFYKIVVLSFCLRFLLLQYSRKKNISSQKKKYFFPKTRSFITNTHEAKGDIEALHKDVS